MKVIAKIVFKIHRLIYKYPTKSEIRLALATTPFHRFELIEMIGMLYLCESSIEEVGVWFSMDDKEVIKELNTLADKVEL